MKTKSLSDLYISNPLKACQLALRRTAALPENDRLEAINSLLGLHGTEAIRGDWQNGYWCDVVAAYCNTGDSYTLTVMQVRGESRFDSSRFIVTTMGDWVERNERKYSLAQPQMHPRPVPAYDPSADAFAAADGSALACFNEQTFARISYAPSWEQCWYPVDNLPWLASRGVAFRRVNMEALRP